MTFDRRKFIKKFINAKLTAIQKKSSDRRHQRQIAKQIAKLQPKTTVSSRLAIFLWFLPFCAVLVIILASYLPFLKNTENLSQHNSVAENNITKPVETLVHRVDNVVEAGLVADAAKSAALPVALEAANLATSIEIEANALQKADVALSKPDLVSLDGLKQDVKAYVVQDGDTIQQLATNFGVSVQTIKWANNLSNDNLTVGKELKILPVDGVYYKVKDGDTYNKIIERYGSNEAQIVAINNLELSGLVKDKMIILPDANLPETERPGYVAPRPVTTVNNSTYFRPASGASVKYYPWGWCTWWAAYRYAQLNGREIGSWGNANTWDNSAYGTPGFTVSSVPTAGAIFQTDYGWAGHVGIVERVNYNEDGSIASIYVSDMNGIAGFGNVGYATWTDIYKYRYIK